MTPSCCPSKNPGPPTGWIRSAGLLFVAATLLPILVGLHIGILVRRETAGALAGVAVGLLLAVALVMRPLWLDAAKTDPYDDDDTPPPEST